MRRDAKPIYSVDGVQRSREIEHKLNEAFAIAFKGAVGQTVLDYLKSITLNSVCGPLVSNEQLRHIEGQRYIVSLIQTRIVHGQNKEPGL